MKLKLKAPAKINLGLKILGKLANGYHEVETIYTQISFFDLIELEEIIEDKVDFFDRKNLVYSAAKLLKSEFKVSRGVKISLVKNIPMGSGLGGGSSDAAVVLKGLNQLWKMKLTQKQLIGLGKKIGSDVAYQIIGGTKKEIQGGKEAGVMTDLGGLVKGWIVICVPDIFIGSQEAYSQVEYDKIGKNEVCWHNDFEIWTFKKYPEIGKIKEKMLEKGAIHSLMSGKGSAVFGVFGDLKKAKSCKNYFTNHYKKVFLAENYDQN